ncbi:Hypothetical protein LOCK900_1036 [Lacticaseibacillus rhamnosus LOCK900]|uniref:Uncharacterized protein n=1 Tax=Lacticaseibacillus rhamnosus LRHMDP3 TaxID=1203259 RepID=A0AB33XSR4_LACRH|nr:Hypothetical protein LOCK900_1036 [Lacticaseibacillus rhamnosus LOCK900]EKS49991.1 hypothetical protein LRHMDP3_2102 [Lacticaseibacillus rhamnosus LRHMDP3]EKS51170.1 hypothetical protein LRHMDP2_1575 [Lacticaseibacillus rhamnosus LRHMDP2]
MILENNLLPLHFSRILKKQDSGVKFICNPPAASISAGFTLPYI